MPRVPPTLHSYVVTEAILQKSRELLWESGREGYEAVVVWVGRILDATTAEVMVPVRPQQVSYRGLGGCAVEVPPDGLSELIASLPSQMLVLARLHTHPTDAYHSDVDDTNMLIGHEGAISIVLPFFARDSLDLLRCSVNELRGGRWIELAPEEIADRFKVK